MRTLRWSALLVFVLAISAQAKVVERIVGIVNDRPILLSDVEKTRLTLQREGLVDDTLMQIHDRDKLLKDRQALINFLIDEAAIDSEVKRRSMEITVERVEQEIRNILRNKKITRAQLKDMLAEKGATMTNYQDFIKSSIERQGIVEREVSSRIKISDEDVAAYYLRTNGPSKSQVYEYSLGHILFLPSNGGEAMAKQRAGQVAEKLKAGQSFEKVAEQYSEDPNFSSGGFLGNFKSGEMSKDIDEAVRNLAAGDTSPPVKTRGGIQILKVLKKTVTSDPQLDEKKEQIRGILFADAFKRQFRSWLDQRRDDSFIRMNESADAKTK